MPTGWKPPVIVRATSPGRRASTPAPEPPPALHRSQATSKAFWALTDRWGVPADEKAVRLIDHIGGLTAAGKRPRFAMIGEETKWFAFLMEIDANLQMVSDPGAWLVKRNSAFAMRRSVGSMTRRVT